MEGCCERVGCHERPSLWPGKSTPVGEAAWLLRERAIRPGVLGIISKLTIPCLRLDKSTGGLIEVIFTKASPSDGSQDLFLSMKIIVGSLAGRWQWGVGWVERSEFLRGVPMMSSSGCHSKPPAPWSRV